MLKTYLDSAILKDFYTSEPRNRLEADIFELERWVSYLKYIKSGTDLVITNPETAKHLNLLNNLTSGRGNSKLTLDEGFKGFHKNLVPKNRSIYETFFINEPDKEAQSRYRKKNHHHFGFLTDHLQAFEKLALLKTKTSIPVRKEKDLNQFFGWGLLNEFLLPCSDCIIIDNFLFSESESIWDKNLAAILRELDLSTPVKYNLLIITYRGNRGEIKVSDISSYLQALKQKHQLKANISVVVTGKLEHDRNIFMNYMRINSGSSFNYINNADQVMVNTELKFIPYILPENTDNAQAILKSVTRKIRDTQSNTISNETSGDLKNNLLEE